MTDGHYCQEFIIKCTPFFIQGFNSIYTTTKKRCVKRRYILKEFQDSLESIPLWNNKIIENEYNRFMKSSNCTWLDDLIKAAFIELTGKISNTKVNIDEQIPKGMDFVHKCYINIAREIWRKPQLFYHQFSNIEKKHNEEEVNNLVQKVIAETIRKELPLKQIVGNYLNNINSTSQDESDMNDEGFESDDVSITQVVDDKDNTSNTDDDTLNSDYEETSINEETEEIEFIDNHISNEPKFVDIDIKRSTTNQEYDDIQDVIPNDNDPSNNENDENELGNNENELDNENDENELGNNENELGNNENE